VLHGQNNEFPSQFSRPEPLLFHSSSSSVVLTRLSGPFSRPLYFSENLLGPEIELGTSGSVARNSDHETTEAVPHVAYFALKIMNLGFMKMRIPFLKGE
jgi:hypothetical protein